MINVYSFIEDKVVFNGDREKIYDLVVFVIGFFNIIDFVCCIFGDDVVDCCKLVWGMDEEGEFNFVWWDIGVLNLWVMVGIF